MSIVGGRCHKETEVNDKSKVKQEEEEKNVQSDTFSSWPQLLKKTQLGLSYMSHVYSRYMEPGLMDHL